ncbi:ABC transporter permease subunit, partial [Streptomyces scabiei]
MTTVTAAERVVPGPRALAAHGLATLRRHPLIVVLALLVLVFQLSTGSFLDPGNLRGIATDAAALAIVAVPLALLVISGYLDLSVGSTLALGALTAGWLAGERAQSPVVAVLG